MGTEWAQIITICGTIVGGLAFLSGIIIWMVGKVDADVSTACGRIDDQGKRIDKLIYAFMEFQRGVNADIREVEKDINKLEKIIPEFKRK
jgi:hypothetical protein